MCILVGLQSTPVLDWMLPDLGPAEACDVPVWITWGR